MPDDGKPEHLLPYTPLGLEALEPHEADFLTQKRLSPRTQTILSSTVTRREFLARTSINQGQLRFFRRLLSVVHSLPFGKVWRVVWTDGRELPKDPEPRWYGYSVGKWVDDYTLVVQTSGTDERTWIDRAGRPHSADLRVEERFHRVDRDHLELTVTIDDPKMYTKPWVALDKFVFELGADQFRCPGDDLVAV